MNKGITVLGHDYTLEIIRCARFIVSQIKKGWNVNEAMQQSISSYGFVITHNALLAIKRNI